MRNIKLPFTSFFRFVWEFTTSTTLPYIIEFYFESLLSTACPLLEQLNISETILWWYMYVKYVYSTNLIRTRSVDRRSFKDSPNVSLSFYISIIHRSWCSLAYITLWQRRCSRYCMSNFAIMHYKLQFMSYYKYSPRNCDVC